MSRLSWSVGAVALTFVSLVLGMTSPAAAASAPPAPLTADRCGTSKDQFKIPDVDTPSYHDSDGEYLPKDVWLSTGGAASVTVVAWSDPQATFTLTFGTEPDATCVEALDTVTTKLVACNPGNGGTRVSFTYTNVDDATDWWHTDPYLEVERWDRGQSAQVWPAFGKVADGASTVVTSGDSSNVGRANEFFLAPGTYAMTLRTDETGSRRLPNRLFVPACGSYRPPKGDPLGGPLPPPPGTKPASQRNRPTASIGTCRAHKARVLLDGRKATRATRYKVVVDPRKGKTKRMTRAVAAGRTQRILLRKQRSGTVVKIVFNRTTIKRKLRC